MTKAGEKLISAAEEALAISRGDMEPARETFIGENFRVVITDEMVQAGSEILGHTRSSTTIKEMYLAMRRLEPRIVHGSDDFAIVNGITTRNNSN